MQAVAAAQVLKLDGEMLRLAEQLKSEQSLLVFGRGYNYATALEAALKVGAPCCCPVPPWLCRPHNTRRRAAGSHQAFVLNWCIIYGCCLPFSTQVCVVAQLLNFPLGKWMGR